MSGRPEMALQFVSLPLSYNHRVCAVVGGLSNRQERRPNWVPMWTGINKTVMCGIRD